MIPQTTQQHAAGQAQFAANQEAERRRFLKLVNTAAAQLGWRKTGAWQVVKAEVGFYGSAADADIEQLEAILEHAKKCGFKVQHKASGGGKSRPIDRTDPARKLRKLWLRGHALGIIKSPDESALCSWASNSRAANVTALLEAFGPKDWEDAIERLKKWLYRDLQQGGLHCPNGHRSAVGRTDATALIWEKPVHCPHCRTPVLAEWRPKPTQPRNHGRRRV